MFLALLAWKVTLVIRVSMSATEASANALMVGNFLNSAGVTVLTSLSVHWAAMMVATRSSKGVV